MQTDEALLNAQKKVKCSKIKQPKKIQSMIIQAESQLKYLDNLDNERKINKKGD